MENQNNKTPIRRTVDSYIDDKNLNANPKLNIGSGRWTQTRRDKDTEKNISVTLFDIDNAVKKYFDETIIPRVDTGEGLIKVPLFYAGGEKAYSIQEHGYIRDAKGKMLLPAMAFKRTSISSGEIKFNKVASTQDLFVLFGVRYNNTNRYDRFSVVNNQKPAYQYVVTPPPEFVDVNYEFTIWTELSIQMNDLIEQVIWFGGNYFGDYNMFKFNADTDSINVENTNSTGEDRIIKATFSLKVNARLLPEHAGTQVSTQKVVSPVKISFGAETFLSIDDMLAAEQSGRMMDRHNSLGMNDRIDNRLFDGMEIDDSLNSSQPPTLGKSPGVYIGKDGENNISDS